MGGEMIGWLAFWAFTAFVFYAIFMSDGR